MTIKKAKMFRWQILFILASGLFCDASEILEEKPESYTQKKTAPIDIPLRKKTKETDWRDNLAYSIGAEHLMNNSMSNAGKQKSDIPKKDSDEDLFLS